MPVWGDHPRDPWQQWLPRSPRPPQGMGLSGGAVAGTLIPCLRGFSSGHLARAW